MNSPHDEHPLEAVLDLPARSHEEFLGLLAEVDEALAAETVPGAAYLLYCIGGFVMGSRDEQRLTQDIDVASEIPEPVAEAGAEVARRHNMNAAWLNNQAAGMLQVVLPASRFVELYRGRHLVAYGADDDAMLALKLMSGRRSDIADIVEIAVRTGRTTPEALLDAWDDAYADTPGAQIERHFVRSVIDADVMRALRARQEALSGRSSRRAAASRKRQRKARKKAADHEPRKQAAVSSGDTGTNLKRPVTCGQRLGRKRTCKRKLLNGPCPFHPDSPGSRRINAL